MREACKSGEGDRKALRKEVLRLALPVGGEQLLSVTVSIVSTILTGHLGPAALAALSLATQWVFMAITLFDAISTGATALVARSVGAGDWDTANRTVRQSLLVGVAIGLAATGDTRFPMYVTSVCLSAERGIGNGWRPDRSRGDHTGGRANDRTNHLRL